MEIFFIKEVQTSSNILYQVKNNIIARIEQAVNVTGQTKTLILPVVPKNIQFPYSAEIKDYKGITEPYNIPSYKNLSHIEWESFFPNKPYNFLHLGSSSNGYEYVDFLTERLKNRLPFRLVAIDNNIKKIPIFKIIYDDFVLVEDFKYSVDASNDLPYSLKLKGFNKKLVSALGKDDLKRVLVTGVVNTVTNTALRKSGLI